MIMFVKYVYDHFTDFWIIWLGFLGRSDQWYKKHTFRFKVETMTTLSDRIRPKNGQIALWYNYLMFAKCVYIILVKKNIQLSKGIGQFRARSGPILSDPVIRPDPVNTRTHWNQYFERVYVFEMP